MARLYLCDKHFLVSDGSFFLNENVGAAAWTLSSADGTPQWIAGGGRIPEPAEVQSAYCSELGGKKQQQWIFFPICLSHSNNHK